MNKSRNYHINGSLEIYERLKTGAYRAREVRAKLIEVRDAQGRLIKEFRTRNYTQVWNESGTFLIFDGLYSIRIDEHD